MSYTIPTRWLIEGTWRGYRSSQDRVVHRSITKDRKIAEQIGKQYGITYTDGTTLELTVRPLNKGERVKDLKNSYGSLICDCLRYDVWTVDGLVKAQKKVPA